MGSGNHTGGGQIMLGVIRGGAAAADRALGSLGVGVEAARQQARLLKEATSWVQQAPFGPLPPPPPGGKTPVRSLREALELARAHIGTASTLPGLPRDRQAAAVQLLMQLTADLNRVRQQLTGRLAGLPGEGRPGFTRAAQTGSAAPGLASELPGRVGSVESRLSVVERRVGTGPDLAELDRQIDQARRDRQAAVQAQDYENAAVLRDRERQLLAHKASCQDEWAAAHLDLPSLADELTTVRHEVEHLRGLLSQQHIQQQDGTE
ncbi:MAG TPA: UvrB/UvrC motif-containing protein [Streptosporangiaceae bacterium]|nr:UvrB/UvrC motif-containing protein [Streptosporangiaceae bacterium]